MAIQTAKAALFLLARSNSRRFKEPFAAAGTDYPFPAIQRFFVDGHCARLLHAIPCKPGGFATSLCAEVPGPTCRAIGPPSLAQTHRQAPAPFGFSKFFRLPDQGKTGHFRELAVPLA
jgi:hypothetical protein